MAKDKKKDDPREIAMGCLVLAVVGWFTWSWLMSPADEPEQFEPYWRGSASEERTRTFPSVEVKVAAMLLAAKGEMSTRELQRQMGEVGVDSFLSKRRVYPTGSFNREMGMVQVEIAAIFGEYGDLAWVNVGDLAYVHSEGEPPWVWSNIEAFVGDTNGGKGPVKRAP
ncbi:MAG: hypothetical protein AAFU73_05240 [Planctomycetota bacterium]